MNKTTLVVLAAGQACLRKGWNFHGDIAIALESIASKHYGDIMRPAGKIYGADSIGKEAL